MVATHRILRGRNQTMPTDRDHHRKTPRQARALATVGTILDATALVLVDEGYEHATTNRIAERAGVSIGSLYQYFPNREAVIGALNDRTEAKLSNAIWHAISESESDGSSLRAFVGSGLTMAVSEHARVLPLLQALVQANGGRAPVRGAGIRLPHMRSILRSVLDNRADELRPDLDREAGFFFIPTMVFSALDAAVAFRPAAFANGELERELTAMLSHYLLREQ
jgi:AcrR family transcriptional regulator